MTTYVIVGCGGVGYAVAEPLTRMLVGSSDRLILIDGKTVKESNLSRQYDTRVIGTNKATALRSKLLNLVPESSQLSIEALPYYLEEFNLKDHNEWLTAKHLVVFVAADSKASRVLCETVLEERKSFILISGGNHELDGQASITIKKNGVLLTPLPSTIHQDLLENDGRTPSMIPCDEAAVSEPQIVVVNMLVAAAMLSFWYSTVVNPSNCKFNYVNINIGSPEIFPSIKPVTEQRTSNERITNQN